MVGKDAASAAGSTYRLTRCWQHGKQLLASIQGITDRNQALAMRGLAIFVDKAALTGSLDDDDYLWHDLIGCQAMDQQHTLLGTISRLENYGSSDILVIQAPEKRGEWMIPFTEAIIQHIDLDTHQIQLDLPDGMDACFTPKS